MNRKRGFTLIELLAVIVVLAIVMVLAATTVLPYMSEIRKKAFITEVAALKKAGENATNLITNGVITNNYKKTSNGYCITLDNLKNLGLFKKDDDNYEGIVNVIKEGNSYKYTVSLKNKEYYVNNVDGEVKESDVLDNSNDLDIVFSCDNIQLEGDAYAIITEIGEDSDGEMLYNLTFLRSKTPINKNDIYEEKVIIDVFSGFEDEEWKDRYGLKNLRYCDDDNDCYTEDVVLAPEWTNYYIKHVDFKNEIRPSSTAAWFYNPWANYYGLAKEYMDEIEGLSLLNTSNVTDMSFMFSRVCYYSDSCEIDILSLNTENVLNMSNMFAGMGVSASKVNVLGLENLNVSNVTNMSGMFNDFASSVADFTLNLSDWDVSNVTNMSSMFESIARGKRNESNFASLKIIFSKIENGNVKYWDTSKVTNMSHMFDSAGFRKSENWSLEGLEYWDTSKVTNMSYMFNQIDGGIIANIGDISNWDVSSVVDMSNMFYAVSVKVGLNLSEWIVDNVTTYNGFNGPDNGSCRTSDSGEQICEGNIIPPNAWNIK